MNKQPDRSSRLGPKAPLFLAICCVGVLSSQTVIAAVLEEIVVTAQKKTQSLMDVGITMSIVNEEAIKDARIEKTTDIVQFTSNTSVKEQIPGLMPIVTIRGVGLNDYNAANSPTAGVYIDEVPLSSLALMSSEYIDLASIEVLKGPQGSLYGRNATAGALSFRTAAPSFDSFHSTVNFGVANYESRELEGIVNTPLSDSVALRVAVKGTKQNEGFWFNRVTNKDVGSRDELTGRAQLLWRISDDTDLLVKFESQKSDNELGSAEFWGAVPNGGVGTCPGSPSCSDFLGYSDNDDDPYKGDWSIDPDYNLHQRSLTVRFEHDLGFAELTGVTGFIDFDREYGSDVDAGPVAALEFYNSDDVEQRSTEWRLSGEAETLDWQVGVFWAVDEVETQYSGVLGLFNTTSVSRSEQKANSKAIFTNLDWSLTEEWSLIVGLRLASERKEIVGNHYDEVSLPGGSLLSGAAFGSPPVTLAYLDDSVSDTSVEWKFGANRSIGENALFFASISQGTKSGGFFTGAASSQQQLLPYESETLRAFEIGLKGSLMNVALSYEASLFYYDYQDVQTFIADNSGPVLVQRLSNVDSADLYGADLALTWKPELLDGLTFTSNVGLLRTELSAFNGAAAGIIPEGNEMPDAPEVTFRMGVNYQRQLGSDVELSVSLDSRYQGATYRDAANDPILESDSYWLSNANAKLMFTNGWEMSLWGKNITDERYLSQGFNQISLGNGYRVYGAPRTYGLTVRKHFE